MKKYKKLLLLSLSFCYFLMPHLGLIAQQPILFEDLSGKGGKEIKTDNSFIMQNDYGNKIIISDHVPNGGDNLCYCAKEERLSYGGIQSPTKRFIPWTTFNAQVEHEYSIEITGKKQTIGSPTVTTKLAFIYYPELIPYNQCNGYKGKEIENSIVYEKSAHPKYSISFHTNGIVIKFNTGVITSLKINALPGCTDSSENRKKQIDDLSLTISPNPFQEVATLGYEIGTNSTASLSIYTPTGQRVVSFFENKFLPAGIYQQTITHNLAKGIYYAILQTKEKRKIIKLVKQ
ncbi:MAG: T9SS type A sorting domain-containing protein [Saprospiraceae bacterium]